MRETRQVRWLAGAGAVVVAAAATITLAGTAQAAEGTIRAAGAPEAIPGSYIVKLKDFSTASVDSLASK
ncbi:MAG: S8 family peptidase, partial [Umezawaea sp.]